MEQKPQVRKPDIVRQYGPYFGEMDEVETILVNNMKKMGYPWIRSTREGRMILVEGWLGKLPPEHPSPVPELRGKLPEGWRPGR